jgi:tetratricopeptide (TPR) repeat protein
MSEEHARFFSWDEFAAGFGGELEIAQGVYDSMRNSGLVDNALLDLDFSFVSDECGKLQQLADFLLERPGYGVSRIAATDAGWELEGRVTEMPVTLDFLTYWALDLYKSGYEHDAKAESYGGEVADERFPDLDASKQEFWFDQALACYDRGDLSGAIIGWTHVLSINPQNPDALFSRAIVKNELFTWKAALADYDAAIAIAPAFAAALVNRGSLRDDHGDTQGALADYDRVIALPDADLGNRQMAYFNRGNTLFKLGDRAGACAHWAAARDRGADFAQERIDEHCR